jgi:CDP-diglyceride synthetase
MLNNFWFMVSPIWLSFAPFSYDSMHIDTSDALFKLKYNEWHMGILGTHKFNASPIQVHLFQITCFIAVVAPFGALFMSALKRMFKAENLGSMFTTGGVIDRLATVLITGLFLFVFMENIAYKQYDAVLDITRKIMQLSPEN